MTEQRKTAISWVESEKITIRGYDVSDLIGNVSFGSAIFLVLRGELPNESAAKLFEAILSSVIDHGVRPPSTIAAATVANTGAGLNSAVAAGILAINKYHGGAIEDAMTAIGSAVSIADSDGSGPVEAARELVAQYKSEKKRVSGFGHRFHAADPRTSRLFAIAGETGYRGRFVSQAEAMEQALTESVGKNMPINADGAIAALLCELGFPPASANGLFMIARVPGLVAHVVEEQGRNRPMYTIDPDNYQYDGLTGKKL